MIGTGALGSELCRLLAKAGHTTVLLIDPDAVEPRNLQRSPWLREAVSAAGLGFKGATSGSNKTSRCNDKATLLMNLVRRAGLAWKACVAEIADVGLAQLRDFDVVCCCTDSALSRAETALAARLLGLPMLDCGVFGDGIDEGRVTWFAAAADAACFLCGVGEQARARLLAYAASASLGCAPLDAEPAMTGTSASVRQTAARAFQLLHQDRSHQERTEASSLAYRLRLRHGAWSSETIGLHRSESCPWHEFDPARLTALDPAQTFAASLRVKHGQLVRLNWPICTVSVCRECGLVEAPMRRVAWVRRRQRCTRCGTVGSAEPQHCVHTVAPTGELADCTPQQLHLPAASLYSVCDAFTFTSPAQGAYV